MERLTKIFEDGPTKVLTICQARCGDAIVWKEWSISKDAAIEESLMRLAAYEDTGLSPADIADLRNELCQRCGQYRRAHLGACDGCRWKKGME